MSRELAIGKVKTSFGLRGEVKIHSYSGEFEHFARLKEVSLRTGSGQKVWEIESFRVAGDFPIFKFKGIDTPEDAKLLAGQELWVDRDKAAPLADGEYYLSDLIGIKLVMNGEVKGTVTGFLEGGASELLEVRLVDGNDVIVPFMEMYLGKVDLKDMTIELKVDWILE